MTRTNVRRRAALAIAATALAGTLPAATADAEPAPKAPTTKFDPTKLDRGKTRAAYVDGKTLHDGKKKLKLNVPHDVWDVHRLKRGYLVETDDPKSGWGVILYRVGTGGKVTKLRRFSRHVWSVTVDSRGEKVAVQIFKAKGGTPLTVFDAYTNKVQRRTDIGKKNVLNYVRGRILVTRGVETSTLQWYRPGQDEYQPIGKVPGWAWFADPSINVVGLSSRKGGCYDVRSFKAPRTLKWRLCADKGIQDGIWFSPNGKYALTRESVHDQPRFETVYLRRVSDGSVVRKFKAPMFSSMAWENNKTIVLEAAAHKKAARVRCTVGGKCTRVSRFVKAANNFYALDKLDTLFLDVKVLS